MQELSEDLGRVAGGSMPVPTAGMDVTPPGPAPDPVFRPCRTNGLG